MKLIHYLRKLDSAPILHVWPEYIVYKSYIDRNTEIVLDGDWDRIGWLVKDTPTFKSFQDRLNGVPWKETELYKIGVEKKRHWLGRLRYWDRMLNDIVKNGYTHRPIKNPIDSYISVLIGRNGDIIFHNGLHRLCSCLLSSVRKKIPVKVILRHPEWEKFRNEVIQFKERRGTKQVYCHLPHPDLEHIKHLWNNERADIIAGQSLYPGGDVVDVGCNWGTISYCIAQKGFNVLAVENAPVPWKFLSKISKFPGKPFKITKKDFTKMKITADTLLMLNIAHHFIFDKGKRKKFVQFLNELNVKEIFYQANRDGDKWSRHTSLEDFHNLIMSESGMTKSEHLATYHERSLYHLT